MRRPAAWGAVAWALLAAAGAQEKPRAEAAQQQAVSHAEAQAGALRSQGKLPEAARVLSAAKGQCTGGAAGESCRRALDYRLGYLYQSSAEGESKPESLRLAADSYEELLSETPAHAPTIENLLTIYRELGEPERAVRVLEHAMEADPEARGSYALPLGDLYLNSKRPQEARRLYEAAAEENPGDEAAVQRLVLTYDVDTGQASMESLIQLGQRLEETFPASAREAYETAMRTTYRKAPEEAERSLVLWAALLARGGSISTPDLESLPADWDSPLVRELRAYLQHPESGVDAGSRWAAAKEGRASLLQTAVALGRQRLGRGEVRQAEAIWQGAAAVSSPGEISSALLELQIELASLYSAHPELDPGGQKFLRTEIGIFASKEAASDLADPRMIQRYHSALGLLYVERGQWTSKSRARGVIYQLWEALRTADGRWRVEGYYQPLARLRELLAEGYQKTGDKEAFVAYLDACRAYLDTDDLKGAQRALAVAHGLMQAKGAEEDEALARILRLRTDLAREKAAMHGLSAKLSARVEALAGSTDVWLPGMPPQSGLEMRQRFKIFADAAEAAGSAEATAAAAETALRNAGRALSLATGAGIPLVGAGDLLRLEKVQKRVVDALGLAAKSPVVISGGRRPGQAELALSLPTDTGPALVRISPSAVTAAKVLAGLGAGTVLKARPQLQVKGGALILHGAAPGWSLDSLAGKVRAKGIDVELAPEAPRQPG